MKWSKLPLLLILALTATSSIAFGQITVEQIDRRAEATVWNYENLELYDTEDLRSLDGGPLNLFAEASLIGQATTFQGTDLLNEATGLTFGGVYRVHVWQETPEVSEVYECTYLTILVFAMASDGAYELTLTPAADTNGANVFLLDLDDGSLLDTIVDSEQTFTGTLESGNRYLLQVNGGYSDLMTAPFDQTFGLDIDFRVTPDDPVATDGSSWSEVKALFD